MEQIRKTPEKDYIPSYRYSLFFTRKEGSQ